MIAQIEKSILSGEVSAPPSKSMSHRLLLLAALSGGICKVENLAWSQDVLAMIDCLKNLGCRIETDSNSAILDGSRFLEDINPELNCRESGNTLRFLIPLCLTLGRPIKLKGSGRLMERPQEVYEIFCAANGFKYTKNSECIMVMGSMKPGNYSVSGRVSSQFISGILFGLMSLDGESRLYIIPPFESRPYVDMTVSAISEFGGKIQPNYQVGFNDVGHIAVKGKTLHPKDVICEGDWSNAAFLEAFNYIGGSVKVNGLSADSTQGDRVYRDFFPLFDSSAPEIDISDCPDLGPVLMALGSLKNGCKLTGTRRLAMKESDRGEAMRRELQKFGCDIIVEDNSITVPKTDLKRPEIPLYGHNDHRIVMSLALICSVTGGEIAGCEAVSKTFPDFFEVIKSLGCDVIIRND